MEKESLYIFKFDAQGNKVRFPNSDMPAKLGEYTYSAQRMAGTPTLTATLNYPSCLDELWTGEEFVEFRGEKYYIDQVPTSSKDNKNIMYKHELQFVSERIVLENVYFMDVVTAGADTYHSNSTSVKFMGDINEFVSRLNASIARSGISYTVVIDDNITSDSKLVSLDGVYLADALQSIYTIYELPYYFVGKVCHIGYTENVISTPFEYRKGLVSIKKTNANYRIVNRVTGVGSSDNIPFYYPNDDETGTIERCQNLMPPIYRESDGAKRFYNALDNTYKIPGTNDYYSFKNLYSAKKVKEIKVDFSDIKPSIEGVTNTFGKLFGEISDIAFDANDSDELGSGAGNNVFNGTDEYVHSYFYIKLNIYNGDYGFNLFEQGLEGGTAVINMTTGNCAACEFEIGVTYKNGENRAYNPVLLGPTGNLIPGDFEQKVASQLSQYVESQQDTSKNEVWIAVKKDNTSFGVVMPNATNNYKPAVGDKFVITGIKMPKPFVLAAEKRLEEALIKYMSENNDEKFTFSVNFSRVFLADNSDLADILNENARIYIKYNSHEYLMYVSSFTCKADKNCLYDISVELTDKLSANVSALRSTIAEIAGDIIGTKLGGGNNISASDIIAKVSRHFLSKTQTDRTPYKLSSDTAFEVGNFVTGATGGIFSEDSSTGQSNIEVDRLYVRMKALFESLEIVNTNSIAGRQIISPAGAVRLSIVYNPGEKYNIVTKDSEGNNVEDEVVVPNGVYRCFFLAEQDGQVVENRYKAGDQVQSKDFNIINSGQSNQVANHYYWRLVSGVSESFVTIGKLGYHYVDLSVSDCDTGSNVPFTGDVIAHLGNRNDADRQNALVFSSVDTFSPSIILYQGINSYSYLNKDVVSYGVDKTTGKAFFNVYGEMYIGDREGDTFIKYTQSNGVEIKGKLAVGTTIGSGKTIEDALNDATQAAVEEVDDIISDLSSSVNDLSGTVTGMKGFTDKAFADGIIDRGEASAIEKYLNNIETTKSDVKNAYEKVYVNALLDGVALTNLKNAYSSFNVSANELINSINDAIADGITTSAERADVDAKYTNFNTKYGDFIAYLNAANQYIQDKINANANDALTQVGGLSYLKKALKEDTSIEGGLIQSSVLALGYTNDDGTYKVMSGTSGIYDSAALGGGIASWWGGSRIDRDNYVDGEIPSDAAKALIRMDGSGYLADGGIWWGTDGKIHADPQSFIISENQLGDYLELFQIIYKENTNTIDYIIPQYVMQKVEVATSVKIGDVYLKKHSSGILEIDGDLIVTGAVTMYAQGNRTASTILDALPIDDTTLSKADGKLSVIGGGGSGINGIYVGSTLYTPDADKYITLGDYYNAEMIRTANTVLAAPNGSNGSATFRRLVAADIPSLPYSKLSDAPASLKNPYALTITLPDESTTTSYDGSAAKSLTLTRLYKSAEVDSATTDSGTITPYAMNTWTKKQYVTALGTSGNYLTWTKNGATNNITVPYASVAGKLGTANVGSATNPIYLNAGTPTACSYTFGNASGNAALNNGTLNTNLNADMIDGVHFQNMLERSYSGTSRTNGATGWFRIGVTKLLDANSISFMLTISRGYSYSDNQAYTFSINIVYAGYCTVNQISGATNVIQLDKIRVTGTNSGSYYVDVHINTTADNQYYWTSIGQFRSYTAWEADAVALTNSKEFKVNEYNAPKFCSSRNNKAVLTYTEAPYLDAGNTVGYTMGVEESNYNYAYIGFRYKGKGSAANIVGIGIGGIGYPFNILGNGNVGIGTESPTEKLTVNGNIGSTYYLLNNSATNPYLRLTLNSVNWYTQAYQRDGADYLYVGAGSANSLRIDTTGNVLAPGAVTMYSDIRKKDVLEGVMLPLEMIAEAPLFSYTYKGDKSRTLHIGTSAQYWQDVPGIVRTDGEDGYLTMDYNSLLSASVFSLAKYTMRHETEIERLKRENEEMRQRINELERRAA